jgi:hypothetical protein
MVAGLIAVPSLAEAASKKPGFEKYVSTSLDAIGVSLSSQATTLQGIQNDLAALSSELDKADSLLGNARLLDALQSALTDLTTNCRSDRG